MKLKKDFLTFIMNLMRKIKSFFYSLPFGMKAAENEMTSGGSVKDGDGVEIQQNVSDGTVFKHLLKGEVTQEVEELRYRTYKVERESKNYKYIGGGQAIKKELNKSNDFSSGKFKFSQENKQICADVLSSLDLKIPEKYTITVSYTDTPRFNIEKYATMVDVKIDDGENIYTTLHFSEYPNKNKLTSKAFINDLKSVYECSQKNDSYGVGRYDTFSSFLTMSFVTYKATNDQPDLFSFVFISPTLIRSKRENGEYMLVYKWNSFTYKDITEDFKSDSMEEKYNNKEKKELNFNFDDITPITDISLKAED